MKQTSSVRKNWMLRAAGVLLCLVLASSYLVCGLFARYTTSASGSDSARVAKFHILEAGYLEETITANLAPGEIKEAALMIQNDSEVAVEYEVTVTNVYENLPLDFRVQGMTENGSTFTAALPANGEQRTYILEIIWPKGEEGSAEYKKSTSPEYSGMVDVIKVGVSVTQID